MDRRKKEVIYSKRCFIEGQLKEATIDIEGGKISRIKEDSKPEEGMDFHDYKEAIVMPGIIDVHVHINEPGRTGWEGFETATQAACMGGVTTMIEMPLNADPVTTTAEAFDTKIAVTEGKLYVHCGFYGGVVPSNCDDIESLIQRGVFGIKGFLCPSGIDEFEVVGEKELAQVAPILKAYDLPLLLHCEIVDEQHAITGDERSYQTYVDSRPKAWEERAIDLAIKIQQRYDIRVHIVHLATATALPRIIQAKASSSKLTVETCPHYLYFEAEGIPDGQPLYKCAPPIREAANRKGLWEAVRSGTMDFIASDHSPAPPDIKELDSGNLLKAWGGIAGLQFTLTVMNTLRQQFDWNIEQMIPLLTQKPAEFVGLQEQKGKLAVGYDGDIVVWDETKSFTVEESDIFHKHKASPYVGEQLRGNVIDVYVNGVSVVHQGTLTGERAGTVLYKNNSLVDQSPKN